MNPQKPSPAKLKQFSRTVWDYYAKNGRHALPWRKTRDPYEILVSEIMLQQTQVSRVMTKWPEFLTKFPTVAVLAKAPVADVLKVWQGLGYNRRALNLRRAAEAIVHDFGGKFPRAAAELESLPGIGQSTRGAIMAFAFGLPSAFIETNIRAIYIHHFFPAKDGAPAALIHDRDLLPLIEKTLDRENPRDWYYALMDYGVHLKQTLPNPSRKSVHHAKQSSFKGSNREVRSRILKFALARSQTQTGLPTRTEIIAHVGKTVHDVEMNIDALVKEGFMDKPL